MSNAAVLSEDWLRLRHWDFPGIKTAQDLINWKGGDADAVRRMTLVPGWRAAPPAVKSGVEAWLSSQPSATKRFNPLELRDAHGEWTHGSLEATVKELRKHGDSTERHEGSHDGYTAERRQLHASIVEDSLKGHESKAKPVATFMGGGAGAGKSSLGHKMRGAVIDADAYKEKLPEYQALKQAGEKDAAGYTYREGSRMAQDAVTEATDRHLDFTLDGAGAGGYESMKERTDNARRGGHHIHAVYVTTDTNEAVRRAEERGKRTGRYIPEPIIRAAHQSVTDTFRDAVNRGGLFDSAELWDNNGPKPKLIGEMKPGQKFQVYDQEAWNRFLAKGTPA